MLRSRLLWALTAAASLGVLAIPAGTPASAQTTSTLFDRTDVICEKRAPLPGARNSFSPGVTPNSITIADVSNDTDAQRKLGIDVMSYHDVMQVYVDAVNNCGGINGRKIILKRDLWNPGATDQVGHLQALCLKVTEDQKAFMAIAQAGNVGLTRCVSVQHKTMIEAAFYTPTKDFKDSQGRAFSYYPSAEGLVGSALTYGQQQNMFAGKKITVVGQAIDATISPLYRTLYIDALKSMGYDADLEMLPCTGTVCTQGLGNAVRRMKLNGTNMIVVGHNISSTTAGAMMAEFERQQLKARILSPMSTTTVSDVVQATILASASVKGVSWTADQMGWTAVGVDITSQFRAGVKESPMTRTCHNYLGKALKQAPYQYKEFDMLNGGHWTVPAHICLKVRQVARALYALGNNITTDRAVKAIHDVKPDWRELKGGIEAERSFAYYQWPRVNPEKVTTTEFQYPCPQSQYVRPCFLPTNRPPRWFPVKIGT